MPDLHEREILLSENPTPPQRRPQGPWWQRRGGRLLGSGIVFGLGLLAVVLWLDRSSPTPPSDAPDSDMGTVAGSGPAPLDPSRLATGGMEDPDLGFDLSQGGWIQIARPDGGLWQQYTCSFLDPAPDGRGTGWIELADPVVEQYLSNGGVMVLKGDRALASAPGQRLEGGRLTGAVTVEFFEAGDDGKADRDGAANMVLSTEEAIFDNQLGEITCPGEVVITTPREELSGTSLTIVLNDIDQRIEHLHLASLHYMMLTTTDGTGGASPASTGRSLSSPAAVGADVAPSPAGIDDRGEKTWYELRLPEHVVIQQGSINSGRLLQGDQLTVRFAMERESLPVSARTGAPTTDARAHFASAISSVHSIPSPGEHQALVTCEGAVTMSPWQGDGHQRPAADEAIVELSSSPGSDGVRIDDRSMDAVIYCSTAAWRTASTQLDLARGHLDHVHIATPTMRGAIDHLTIDQGAGTVVATAGDGDRVGRLLVEDDPQDGTAPSSITWTQSLNLSFTPAEEDVDPVLEQAVFTGDVQFSSADGSLSSPSVTIDFAPSGDGRAAPSAMHADGGVTAADARGMMIWASTLQTTFLPPDPDASPPTPTAQAHGLLGDGVRVDDVHAAGDVQVKTGEDARIFADDLVADVQTGRLELRGEDVVIAHDRMLIHHGTHVVVTQEDGQARWNGGGTGWLLTSPLDLAANRPIMRPPTPTSASGAGGATMQTQWKDRLIWHGEANDGAGAVELLGDVTVRNRPTPHERNTITGDHLHVNFSHVETVPPVDEEATRQRGLHTFVATGDARIQHWTWPQESAESDPDLFYITGDRIEYNDVTLEAHVPAAGSMVIRQAGEPGGGPLLGAGTTRMTWEEGLDLTRQAGEVFALELREGVTVAHAGETPDDTGTLAADMLTATVLRSGTQGKAREDRPGDLELGGSFDITRIFATNGVHLSARGREADGTSLDYNPRTGVTTILGRPDRSATIRTQGSPQVVRAEKFIWRMDENAALDTVTIIKGVTSGGD